MGINISRYVNQGEGFKLTHSAIFTDSEAKELSEHIEMVEHFELVGFLRFKTGGVVGMTFEKHDLEKSMRITFERVVD